MFKFLLLLVPVALHAQITLEPPTVSTATVAPLAPKESSPTQPPANQKLLKSKQLLLDSLKKDPQNIELLRSLSLINQDLGLVEQSQEITEKILALNPQDAGAYSMLALIFEKKKQTQKAISAWENCLKYAKEEKLKSISQKHLAHLKKQWT